MNKIYSRPRLKIPQFVLFTTREKQKSKKRFNLILIVFIAFATLKIVLDAVIPIFDTLCENKAISLATVISNNKAREIMKNHTYEELFTIEKDANGKITTLKANVIVINQITSDIAVEIQEEMNKQGGEDVKIALREFYRIKVTFRKRT